MNEPYLLVSIDAFSTFFNFNMSDVFIFCQFRAQALIGNLHHTAPATGAKRLVLDSKSLVLIIFLVS